MIEGFLHFVQNYIITFLLILTVLVFVHELGHYLVARWNGVGVDVFSIGFGPELIGWTSKSGTRWRLSAIPLGGYVKMFGMDDIADMQVAERSLTEEEHKKAFFTKRVGQRAAIVAAGPIANFLFAIVVMAGLFMFYGQTRIPPVVQDVIPESAAAEAGLQPGDRILSANGQHLESFKDLQQFIMLHLEDPVILGVERHGMALEFTMRPRIVERADFTGTIRKTPILGVIADTSQSEKIRYGVTGAVWAAMKETVSLVQATYLALGQIVVGKRDSSEVTGIIRIAEGTGQIAQLGWVSIISYTSLLSINLGLINLLPIPLLDGGHLVFFGIEAIRRKPLGEKAQEYSFRIGLFLLLAVMLFATWNDLVALKIWDFLKTLVS